MSQRAVVVFLGRELVEGASRFSRWLKPGFVHCFLLLERPNGWIKVEGQRGVPQFSLIGECDDVVTHYESQGATVALTTVQNKSSRSPLVARNCVGLTKAVLGLRSWALTPWQLYKHLTKGIMT